MSAHKIRYSIFCVLICFVAQPAQAELVLCRIPGTQIIVSLQGTTKVHPGGTLTFQHSRFGNLVFSLNDVRIFDVPTNDVLFRKKFLAATQANDADEMIKVAKFALKHGMLKEFREAVDKALEIDPQNRAGRRVRYAQEHIGKSLGESEYEEARLYAIVERKDMKIKKSDHFILLYDTSDEPLKGRQLSQAEERLQLLETVYETFMMQFFINNVKLEVPQERLMVVLFSDEKDYLRFTQLLDPSLHSAAGFWVPTLNVSVFYAQGTGRRFEQIIQTSERLQAMKKQALRFKPANTREIVRAAEAITLLVEIEKENQNVSVVSHEATHHLAGNTGLLPRGVHIPTWVHEGLATFFEAPDDAVWSGMGAVNDERLTRYRALEHDTQHSNIDFITENRIFSEAGSLGSVLHGYGQAWALTHFLMERHFDKLIEYYRLLGEQKEGERMTPEQQGELFRSVFGKKTSGLEAEWRAYMNKLETDTEKIQKQLAQ